MTEIQPDYTVAADGGVTDREGQPVDLAERHAEDATEEPHLTAAGGWAAPSETLYGFPEISVLRGGIQFTMPQWPKPLAEWSKKELRAEIDRLQDVLDKTQRRHRKAERKVERLLRIIRRLA